ncbi:hypothetical protein AXG93_698s1110 [Marchantia polymorpha subsp. ruderalis]|uniref:AP2/ERF domain-containing protein n=1 Tax=Marchantia polymorpha subsp. ruderalis TaxID=1480154 RepID=A0A176VG72_MARPO|nr:hypothetical protein AXG93_698s1110 [Marchantia polymorpha subsp. ruderalis]
MAANSNVGSTNSGSSRRTSSSGGRAGSVASSLSKTLSAGSNAEVNSSETSSGSFSCMTTTTSSGSEGAVAASIEMVGGGGGLRRAVSAGGKTKKRFVGVRQRPSGRWVAEIKDTTQKIRLWLGTFDTAEDAARAYDEAAWLLRGANTRTNFVPSTSTDASVLPSKAARLLQLRKNAAAATASSQETNNISNGATPPAAAAAAASAHVNSKPPQAQSGTSAGNKLEGNDNANSIYSAPPKSPPIPPAVVLPCSGSNNSNQAPPPPPPPLTVVTSASAASTSPYCSSNIGHVSNFSGEVSKSESSNYESSVEEMCEMDEAPGLNNAPGLFNPDLDESQRRNGHPTLVNVKQELVSNTYQPRVELSPIRENRKEKDYCSEAPPQDSFVDDTDMSSGLSGLDDVGLSGVDSCYTSDFDFPADMGPDLDLGSLIPSPLSADLSNGDEEDSLSEHVRRMSYERQISAGLYAINGVQECLSLSSHSWGPSSWNGGLSSPSLTLTAGFRRSSTSAPFLTASPVAGWKSVGSSGGSGSSSWVSSSQQQQQQQQANSSGGSTGSGSNGSNNSAVAESAECPSQDALWQSWDLPPLSRCGMEFGYGGDLTAVAPRRVLRISYEHLGLGVGGCP